MKGDVQHLGVRRVRERSLGDYSKGVRGRRGLCGHMEFSHPSSSLWGLAEETGLAV